MLHHALADDGFGDSSDGLFASDGGDLNFYFQADFMVRLYARRNIDIHADILILELRVDERIHQTPRSCRPHAYACLEAARCDRYAVAVLQLSFLAISEPPLQILKAFRLCVRQIRVGHKVW